MNNGSINALERRIDAVLVQIEEEQREVEDIAVVIYDGATGKPCPGYEEAAARDGVVFWLPYCEHEQGYEG
jgi:hypothetical protein